MSETAKHDVRHPVNLRLSGGVEHGVVVAMHGAPPGGHPFDEHLARFKGDGAAIGPLDLINGEGVGGGGVGVPEVVAVEGGAGQFVAGLPDELLVLAHLGAEGGQEVAHDGGVDADVERLLHGFLAQLRAAAGEAEEGLGVDETEEGDGGEHLVIGQRGLMGERCAGDGAEQVDGDGVAAYLLEGEGELDALGHALAHADDAAATNLHPDAAGGLDGAQFLLLGVGGAEGGEVGGGGL